MKEKINDETSATPSIGGDGKLMKAGIGLFALVSAVVLIFSYVPPCHNALLNIRAKTLEGSSPYEAVSIYETLYYDGNPSALSGILRCSIAQEDWYTAIIYIEDVENNHSDDSRYTQILDKYRPAAPTANIESGTYTEVQTVRLTADPDTTETFYSFNSSEMVPYYFNDSYDMYLNQKQEYTLECYSVNRLKLCSETRSYNYVMDIPAPGAVQPSLDSGVYKTNQTLELSAEDGTVIYYTLDGSVPDERSEKYKEALEMKQGQNVIKAVAYNKAGTRGDLYEGTITLELPVPENVRISVPGGRFSDTFTVELTQTEGADIYYSLDGSMPSIPYSGAINVEKGDTYLRAMAVNEYNQQSEIVSERYTVQYNRYVMGWGFTGATIYYRGKEYLYVEGDLCRFDSDLSNKELLVQSIDTINTFQEYNGYIYYIKEYKLYRLDPETALSEKVSDVSIKSRYVIRNERVYFRQDSGIATMALDGTDLKMFYDGVDAPVTEVLNEQDGIWNIRVSKDGGTYTVALDLQTGTWTEVGSSSIKYNSDGFKVSEEYANGEHVIYVNDEEIYRDSSYSDHTPPKGLLGSSVDTTVTYYYYPIAIVHNKLYINQIRRQEETITDWIGNKQHSSSDKYQWYVYDVSTRNKNAISVTDMSLYITDNMVMDGKGNKIEVIN